MESPHTRNHTLFGFLWRISERVLKQLFALVISVILARLLTPDDYSVVGIVSIFFTFANAFIVGGLNTALIQKKNADELDYSVVLYTSLLLSAVAYGVIFCLAPTIAAWYDQPILTKVIRIMGISLPVTAVQSVWFAYISSSMKFKKFFFSTLGSTLLSGGIGIAMAYAGWGVWALVVQQTSTAIFSTLILIISTRIKILFRFSFERFRSLWKYGYKVFLSSLLAVTYSEITPLIISLKFNATDLSFYTKGRGFPGLISNTLTDSISSVLLPFFSKEQDDKSSLLHHLRNYIRLSSFVLFPLMMGFLMVSESFVSVVLTDKWLPTVPYIQIFCLSYMFDMITAGNCEAIKGMGRSDTFLLMEIVKKSLYFITIAAFVFWAKTPIALALSAMVCSVIAVVVNSMPNRKMLGYTYRHQLADILPNLLISIGMSGVVFAVGLLPLSPLAMLIAQVGAGAASYAFLAFITRNPSWKYSIGLIKSFLCRNK